MLHTDANLSDLQDVLVSLDAETAETFKQIFDDYRTEIEALLEEVEQTFCKDELLAEEQGDNVASQVNQLANQIGCYQELLKQRFQVPLVQLSAPQEVHADEQRLAALLAQIQACKSEFELLNGFEEVYASINAMHELKKEAEALIERDECINSECSRFLAENTDDFNAVRIVDDMCNMKLSLTGLLRHRRYERATKQILETCKDTFCIPMEDVCYDALLERKKQLQEAAERSKWLEEILKLIENCMRGHTDINFEEVFQSFSNAFDYIAQQSGNLRFLKENTGESLDRLEQLCEISLRNTEARILEQLHLRKIDEAVAKAGEWLGLSETEAFLFSFDQSVETFEAELAGFIMETQQYESTLQNIIEQASAKLTAKMGVFKQYHDNPGLLLAESKELHAKVTEMKAVEWLLAHCGQEKVSINTLSRDLQLEEDFAMLTVLDSFNGKVDDSSDYVFDCGHTTQNEQLEKKLEEYDYVSGTLNGLIHELSEQLDCARKSQTDELETLVEAFDTEIGLFSEAYRAEVRSAYERIFCHYAAEYNERAQSANMMRFEDVVSRLCELRCQFRNLANSPGALECAKHTFDEAALENALDSAQETAFQRLKQAAGNYKQRFDAAKEQLLNLSPRQLKMAKTAVQFASLRPEACAAGIADAVSASLCDETRAESECVKVQKEAADTKIEPPKRGASVADASEVVVAEKNKNRREPAAKPACERQVRYHLVRILTDGRVDAEVELLPGKIALFQRGKRPEQIEFAGISSVAVRGEDVIVKLTSGNMAIFGGSDAKTFRAALAEQLRQ